MHWVRCFNGRKLGVNTKKLSVTSGAAEMVKRVLAATDLCINVEI